MPNPETLAAQGFVKRGVQIVSLGQLKILRFFMN